MTVSRSLKFCVYDTDFGRRRPKKTELVRTDACGPNCLSENRDDTPEVEIRFGSFRSHLERKSEK
ncbi:Chloramphenicol acetyltransferase-like domain containing protein [Parasponia andersonii]|uniref:Chloramphenicol acetyltransferase-like domain containing protein n=1 Tax=Parasponia andersonii TaxID=3476 RepID=A0A2P5E4R0_PARAD|nr:Chloramphenicol acetyltransferase-like domain containing protein [Parasponia andersonii]